MDFILTGQQCTGVIHKCNLMGFKKRRIGDWAIILAGEGASLSYGTACDYIGITVEESRNKNHCENGALVVVFNYFEKVITRAKEVYEYTEFIRVVLMNDSEYLITSHAKIIQLNKKLNITKNYKDITLVNNDSNMETSGLHLLEVKHTSGKKDLLLISPECKTTLIQPAYKHIDYSFHAVNQEIVTCYDIEDEILEEIVNIEINRAKNKNREHIEAKFKQTALDIRSLSNNKILDIWGRTVLKLREDLAKADYREEISDTERYDHYILISDETNKNNSFRLVFDLKLNLIKNITTSRNEGKLYKLTRLS